MPTVLRDGPYNCIFFSSDRGEPPHIHMQRERYVAKFWPEPVARVTNRGFRTHKIRRITRLVQGSPAERQHWQLLGDGYAIEWPDLDEHIGVEGLLAGRRSGESPQSFARWLASRRTPTE